MEAVEKLVNLTYNKIFFEGLHFLKSDIESIKKIVLENQKLLSNRLEKTLFISDLAEMIKQEKINEAINQKRKYGRVIMQNFESIEALYLWLDNTTIETKTSINNAKVWVTDTETLQRLSEYLKDHSFIDNSDDFYNVIINPKYNSKANWLKSKALLIYLFERLKENFVDTETQTNSFIQNGFLCKGEYIENIKQTKNNIKNNKNSKPQNSDLIDKFFDEI